MCPRCGEHERSGGSYCRDCSKAYQRIRISGKLSRGECRHCNSPSGSVRGFCDEHASLHRIRSRVRRWSEQGIEITEEQFEALLGRQARACAICFEAVGERLNVDHDHSTGKVRGLLCRRCNLLLGKVQDNETILASAINYLRRSRA